MRVVRLWEIVVAFLLMFLFAASLVAGVFRWPFFLLAAVSLGLYFVWEYLYLRCPWCGCAMEPGSLLRGLRRSCHCPSCGHEITVVARVNKSVPEHGSAPKPEAPPGTETAAGPDAGVDHSQKGALP